MNKVDFVVNYELNNKLSFDLIYSDADDNLDKSNSFTNTRVFVNYNF